MSEETVKTKTTFRKRLGSLKNLITRSSSIYEIDIDDDKFKDMDEYIIIDPSTEENRSFTEEELLQKARQLDDLNAEYQRYLNRKMGSIGRKSRINKKLSEYIQTVEIDPPEFNNVQIVDIYLKRNAHVNPRTLTTHTIYLQLNGFTVCDITIFNDCNDCNNKSIIEPYQVIQKAKELAKTRGHNIEMFVKEHFNQNFKIKSATPSAPPQGKVSTFGTLYPNIENSVYSSYGSTSS